MITVRKFDEYGIFCLDWRSRMNWGIVLGCAAATIVFFGGGIAMLDGLGVVSGREVELWFVVAGFVFLFWGMIRRWGHAAPHSEVDSAEEFTAASLAEELEKIRAGTPVRSGGNMPVGRAIALGVTIPIYVGAVMTGCILFSKLIWVMLETHPPSFGDYGYTGLASYAVLFAVLVRYGVEREREQPTKAGNGA